MACSLRGRLCGVSNSHYACSAGRLAASEASARVAVAAAEAATRTARARADAQAFLIARLTAELRSERATCAEARCCAGPINVCNPVALCADHRPGLNLSVGRVISCGGQRNLNHFSVGDFAAWKPPALTPDRPSCMQCPVSCCLCHMSSHDCRSRATKFEGMCAEHTAQLTAMTIELHSSQGECLWQC